MAAEVLAGRGAAVTVYDRMPSAGRKFLLAGRGGLNLTHSEALERFLAPLWRGASRTSARRDRGLPARRRCAPGARRSARRPSSAPAGACSRQPLKASPLLRAWLRRLAAAGVDFKLRHRWRGWDERRRARLRDAGRPDRRRRRRDRAGARRRELAAARLRRRLGRPSGERRRRGRAAAAGQLRLRGRLVGHLPRAASRASR